MCCGIPRPCEQGTAIPRSRSIRKRTCGLTTVWPEGGNVIDLVCELRNMTVRDALRLLEETGLYRGVHLPGSNPALFPAKNERQFAGEKEKTRSMKEMRARWKTLGHLKILKVGDIKHPALIEYLQSRSIDLEIAKAISERSVFQACRPVEAILCLGLAVWQGI